MRSRETLTQPVTIPRWKYHLGHAGTAVAVAYVALAFGVPLLGATLLGAVGWPLVHETYDLRKGGNWPDAVADLVQHQPPWVIYFLHTGDPAIALLTALVIAVLYVATLRWSRP
ncbi:MAG: hypothetical protein ACREL9_05945 [Gemmatimonadales bacterium]